MPLIYFGSAFKIIFLWKLQSSIFYKHHHNHASFTEIIFNAKLFFSAELLLAYLDCQMVLIKHGCY